MTRPGRPPVSTETRSKKIVVRVTPEELARAHALAKAQDPAIELAELVRRLLSQSEAV